MQGGIVYQPAAGEKCLRGVGVKASQSYLDTPKTSCMLCFIVKSESEHFINPFRETWYDFGLVMPLIV